MMNLIVIDLNNFEHSGQLYNHIGSSKGLEYPQNKANFKVLHAWF